jgi:GYF domain 2
LNASVSDTEVVAFATVMLPTEILMSEFWYYAEGNETRGPITFDQLIKILSRLPTPKGVLVWREGLADWTAAENLREIAEKLIRPPPLPRLPPLPSRKPVSYLSPEYRAMNVSSEKPKRNWLHIVATLVAWVFAYGLARSIGGNFWIPVVFIWVSYWILTKLKVQTSIAAMLALLLGHTLWIAAGHAILLSINKPSPDLPWFTIDLIALAVALIWCLKKQSVASCVFVLLYELVGLAVNIVDFNEMSKVSEAAAWMHVSLRAIGCGLAIYAIVEIRQRRQKQDDQIVVARDYLDT